MKEILSFCLTCLIWVPAHCQLAITASSTLNRSIEWQVVTENYLVHRRADFLKYGTSANVDYTFPLKNGSIRIRPAVEFMMANSVYKEHYFQVSTFGMTGNMEFALLSTKDKSGRKRPIRPFLQLSPGIALANFRYERPKDDVNGLIVTSKSHRVSSNFGSFLFFEFKLTPLLTLAPMAGIRYYPNLYWKNFTTNVTKGTVTKAYDRADWLQYHFGLRMGLSLK
jgi:hypothetical protein